VELVEEEDVVEEEEIAVVEAQEVSSLSPSLLRPHRTKLTLPFLSLLPGKQVDAVEETGEVVVVDEAEIVGAEVGEGATETSAEPWAHNCDITPTHRAVGEPANGARNEISTRDQSSPSHFSAQRLQPRRRLICSSSVFGAR
jgi:hypothetical protein